MTIRWRAGFWVVMFFGFVACGAVWAETIHVSVSFSPKDVTVRAQGNYAFVAVKDCVPCYEHPGAPALPEKLIQVLVPKGARIKTVTSQTDPVILDGAYLVSPVQRPSRPGESFSFVPPDPAIYNSAAIYPPDAAELATVGQMREARIATVRVRPIQYYPSARKLVFNRRVDLSVEYSIAKIESLPVFRVTSKAFDDIVRNFVVNPQAESASMNLAATAPGDAEYLIITNEALRASFQPLADWKTTKGIPASIVTIETISSRYTGADLQEKIKRCIQDYAANHGTIWVLLGGDDTIVPDRDTFASVNNGSDTDSTIPADLYYSSTDYVDWDTDDDGKAGEVGDDTIDLYPDVFVGRASVRTSSEASAFCAKSLAYEKTPAGTDFARKLLQIGVEAWGTLDSALPPSHVAPPSNASDSECKNEYLWDGYYKQGENGWIRPYWAYGHTRFYDTNTDFTGNANHDVTTSNILSCFNDGYGIVFMDTHGNALVWGMESGADFSASDASHCSNGNKQGIIYTVSCLTNAFDYPTDPCLSEAFIRNPNGGAVAYIGASRYGWGIEGTPDHGPSFLYARQFFKIFLNDEYETNYRIGAIHAMHKAALIGESSGNGAMRWLQFALNLLGDPELPVLTDDPGTIHVQYDSPVSAGEQLVTVETDAPGALVCIRQEGGGYVRGTADGTGTFYGRVNLDPGSATVTVTAHNRLPYQGTIEVKASGPHIVYRSSSIDDSAGDNDGKADAGETISLLVTVENTGTEDAKNVVGILSSGSAYVSIPRNTTTFGDVPVGQSVLAQTAFDVNVHTDCPDGQDVPFDLSLSGDGYTAHCTFTLSIESKPSAKVSPASLSVIVKPNESQDATFVIQNEAYAPLTFATSFTADSPFGEPDGGPDDGGYVWWDSKNGQGPTYTWQEIRDTGVELQLDDDALSQAIPLGFDFCFYGASYSSVYVSSNGFLTFSSSGASVYRNPAIPDSAAPNAVIAPLWDDLCPESGGGAGHIYYGYGPNGEFIVEYDGVEHYGVTSTSTFEVVLTPCNEINFYYKQIGVATSCTVGIEDADGMVGMQIAKDEDYLTDGLAICLSRGWATCDPSSGTVSGQSQKTITVSCSAAGLAEGEYKGKVRVATNDPESPSITVPVTMTVTNASALLVRDFRASDCETGKSTLTWTNPNTTSLAEVTVRRRTDRYASGPTDGVLVFSDDQPKPGDRMTVVDSGLTNGVTYYYAVFCKGTDGVWQGTVVPGSNADTGKPSADDTGPTIGQPFFSASVSREEELIVTAEISDVNTGGCGVSAAEVRYGYAGALTTVAAGTGPGGDGDGTWVFSIPAQGVSHEGQTLQFLIAASDGHSPSNSSINDNAGEYFSVEIRDADTAAPALVAIDLPQEVYGDETIQGSVQVSDAVSGNHGVASVRILYGCAGEGQGTLDAVSPGGNGDGTWTFEIPAQGAAREGQTLHVLVVATDGDASPSSAQYGPYDVMIVDDDDSPPTIEDVYPGEVALANVPFRFSARISDPSGVADDESAQDSVCVKWTATGGDGNASGSLDMDLGPDGLFVSDESIGPFAPGTVLTYQICAADRDDTPAAGTFDAVAHVVDFTPGAVPRSLSIRPNKTAPNRGRFAATFELNARPQDIDLAKPLELLVMANDGQGGETQVLDLSWTFEKIREGVYRYSGPAGDYTARTLVVFDPSGKSRGRLGITAAGPVPTDVDLSRGVEVALRWTLASGVERENSVRVLLTLSRAGGGRFRLGRNKVVTPLVFVQRMSLAKNSREPGESRFRITGVLGGLPQNWDTSPFSLVVDLEGSRLVANVPEGAYDRSRDRLRLRLEKAQVSSVFVDFGKGTFKLDGTGVMSALVANPLSLGVSLQEADDTLAFDEVTSVIATPTRTGFRY